MDTLQKKDMEASSEAASEDSQQIAPPRWRIVSIISYILAFIWECQKWITYQIFYRAPLRVLKTRDVEIYHLAKTYLYAKFVCKSLFVNCWAFLLIWYMTVRLGCGLSMTRPYLDGICLRPWVDPNRDLPWWLDYWNTSADGDDTPHTLSLSNEAFMTGYLDIHDAVASLRLQASELEALPCINCKRLSSILRKLLALIACLMCS